MYTSWQTTAAVATAHQHDLLREADHYELVRTARAGAHRLRGIWMFRRPSRPRMASLVAV